MSKYIGATVVNLSVDTVDVTGDITATDATPEVIIVNDTHEDTDGGREGKVTFKGQQSGGEETTLAEIQASHDGTSDDEKGDLIFKTNDGSDGASPTEAMRIDAEQNLGLGTNAPAHRLDIVESADAFGARITNNSDGSQGLQVRTSDNDTGQFILDLQSSSSATGTDYASKLVVDKSGNLLVGTTDVDIRSSSSAEGMVYRNGLSLDVSMDGGNPLNLNRLSSDGNIVEFRKDGTAVGSIGSISGAYLYIGDSGAVGISFIADRVRPSSDGADADDTYDFGHPTVRWDDIYATNGTIQTSDENEKQNIASLTSAEITAATAISKLFKTFKWKSKVTAKGDDARTHTGVVAQQVQTAMSDAGLDASKYAFWCSDTWWEADEKYTDDDGKEQTRTNIFDTKDEAPEGATERTRMGVRYPELLAFIGAATEQRLTSIESRLTALEGE